MDLIGATQRRHGMASETRMARRRDGWLLNERTWVRPGWVSAWAFLRHDMTCRPGHLTEEVGIQDDREEREPA